MLTKTKIALVAALVAGSVSVAAAKDTYQTAQVALKRNEQLRSAPVRLQNQGTFQEPASRGTDDHLPGAFDYQVQPGYPQSLPGGAG